MQLNLSLRRVASGVKFDVYAVEHVHADGRRECQVTLWLDGLPPSVKKRMFAILRKHAHGGPILNHQVSRDLGDGFYEFKVHEGPGYRLIWVYDHQRRGVTILTHGVTKGANVNSEKKHAQALLNELGRHDDQPA